MLTELPDRLPSCPHCGEHDQRLLQLIIEKPGRHHWANCLRCRRLFRVVRHVGRRQPKPIGFNPAADSIEPVWLACLVPPGVKIPVAIQLSAR